MSTVGQVGLIPNQPNARQYFVSEGPTLSARHSGVAASFSDAAFAAMEHLLGRPEAQATPDLSSLGGTRAPLGLGTRANLSGGTVIGPDYSHYVGRSCGSGQCVALVQAFRPSIGSTGSWARGEAVQGNTRLQEGTVIATFEPSGRYANATDGSSHAAIYLGQNGQGVQVLDQWAGNPAAVRTIPWTNPSGTAANTGSAFHVVISG